jgi:hypothetical protein
MLASAPRLLPTPQRGRSNAFWTSMSIKAALIGKREENCVTGVFQEGSLAAGEGFGGAEAGREGRPSGARLRQELVGQMISSKANRVDVSQGEERLPRIRHVTVP